SSAPSSHLHSFPTRRSSDLLVFLLRAHRHLLEPQWLASRPERLLPLQRAHGAASRAHTPRAAAPDRWNSGLDAASVAETRRRRADRKSTRLNSSHVSISYAV